MTYNVHFGGNIYATTELESGDAPMACAGGKINSSSFLINFEYLLTISNDPNIELNEVDHEHRFINISTSSEIAVYREDGAEIKGISINITGMDAEHFEIEVLGIYSPLYDEEFPQHVKSYNDQFPEK